MPSATLEQAIVSTQLRDGLAVLRTTSVHDSVATLARLHRQLALAMRRPPGATAWLSFDAYKASCGRPQRRALRELFGHQLLQVPGCGPAKAAAVVREFGTPWRLLAALEPRADRDDAAPPALVSAAGAALSRRLCAVFGPDFALDNQERGAD